MDQPKKTLTRRDALKALAAVTGAATLASVRGQWATPLVQLGALPAHAQCSVLVPGTASLYLLNQTNGTFTYHLYGRGFDKTLVLGPGEGGTISGVPVGDPPLTHQLTLTGSGVSGCDAVYTGTGEHPTMMAEQCYEGVISCSGLTFSETDEGFFK